MSSAKSYRLNLAYRAAATLLNYVGLVSASIFFAVVTLAGARGASHPVSILLAVVGGIEGLFYVAWFLPYRARLQRRGPQPVPLTRALRKELFEKGLEHTQDVELYLRGWFRKAQMADIRVENVKDWLLGKYFDRDGDPGEDDTELNGYVQELEDKGGFRIKKGAGDARPIRMALDPVEIGHRSLSFYTAIGFVDFITTIALLAKGFKYYRQPRSYFFTTFPFRFKTLLFAFESGYPDLSYFYRPHKATDKRPIVLLHGAGVGLASYIPWLSSLPPDIGVLAVEFLPISSRITGPLPPTPDLIAGLSSILANHFASGAETSDFVLVAHSFGTLLLAPLLQRPDVASRVAALVLADPLPLLLHLPPLAHNLTRRSPRAAPRPADWRLRFLATDPGVAHTAARRFCWHDFVLWTEQLRGRRATVLLAGDDGLVDPDAVASYVYYGDLNYTRQDRREWRASAGRWTGQEELALFYLDGMEHGEVFLSGMGRQALGRVVGAYCDRGVAWTSRFAEEMKLGLVTSTVSSVPEEEEEEEEERYEARGARRSEETGAGRGSFPMTRYSEASRMSRI